MKKLHRKLLKAFDGVFIHYKNTVSDVFCTLTK
jgi:hypothetical protein